MMSDEDTRKAFEASKARIKAQQEEAIREGKFIVTAVQQRDPKHGTFVSPDDLTRVWNFNNQVQDGDEGVQE